MNIELHYRSLTAELESLRDRVRNFIDSGHWPTDGEWKESVLRSTLAKRLPETVRIGRGFVLTREGATTQCDVLLYKADAPLLFKDGELVFLTPDAVLGIIEVKSKTDRRVLAEALDKLSAIGEKLGEHRSHCFFGLFSYENAMPDHGITLAMLRDKCDRRVKVVDFINLGCSRFFRWWPVHPDGDGAVYEHWHSYHLENMSAGYFIANIIDFVSPHSVGLNNWLWFPEEGKESRKNGEIAAMFALRQRAD
jgi:hypothetical protein